MRSPRPATQGRWESRWVLSDRDCWKPGLPRPLVEFLGATFFHRPVRLLRHLLPVLALVVLAPSARAQMHVAVRVSEAERAEIKRRLDEAGIENEERDHEIAVGLFFEDPDGRLLEAITYR